VNPLAIDLFCGLGGWTDGLLAEGYDVIGFDRETALPGWQSMLLSALQGINAAS
jgi:hypothetical protein